MGHVRKVAIVRKVVGHLRWDQNDAHREGEQRRAWTEASGEPECAYSDIRSLPTEGRANDGPRAPGRADFSAMEDCGTGRPILVVTQIAVGELLLSFQIVRKL